MPNKTTPTDTALHQALETLFLTGQDAMFIANRAGVFTHVNQSFLNLYHFQSPQHIIGKPMSLIKSHLHPDSFYENLQEQLLTLGQWSGEIRNLSHNGEIIHIWSQIMRTSTGFAARQVDLRERDRSARHLQEAARLESVSTLAGGIAHDFNNILAGLKGHVHMFQRTLPEDNSDGSERLERVQNLIHRASGLVQKLLEFAKQKPSSPSKISILPIIQTTLQLLKSTLPQDIPIHLHVADSLKGKSPTSFILADQLQLKQTFFELISNASDACKNKQDKEPNHQAEINIRLLQPQDSRIEIIVQDNGCGMESLELEHCFDLFFTTKPVGQGPGLGLSTARSYIEQIHGSLKLESNVQMGTEVCIQLPVAIQTKSTQADAKKTILLVDDEKSTLTTYTEILEYSGYHVLQANNGIQALETWQHSLAEDAPNISGIIMDIVMPDMNGLDVAREIRATRATVPICMVTGYSNQDIPQGLKLHLIRKPIAPELIIQYLEWQIKETHS